MKRSRSDEVDLENAEQGGRREKKKSSYLLPRLEEDEVNVDDDEESSVMPINSSSPSFQKREEMTESRMTAEEEDKNSNSPDSLFFSSCSSPSTSSNIPGSPTPPLLSTSEPTTTTTPTTTIYSTKPPPISGLHFFPSSIPASLESSLLCSIRKEGYFSTSSSSSNEGDDGNRKTQNQAMLFGRARLNLHQKKWESGLPEWMDGLIEALQRICKEREVSGELFNLLFPEASFSFPCSTLNSGEEEETEVDSPPPPPPPRVQSRQVILNHYRPPQGLGSHIDLPARFSDGILLCSLVSGIGMQFRSTPVSPLKDTGKNETEEEREEKVGMYRLYLPPRSLLILSGEARWEWEHGIEEAWGDWVLSSSSSSEKEKEEKEGNSRVTGVASRPTFIPRAERISITIRFLKEGADRVGQEL